MKYSTKIVIFLLICLSGLIFGLEGIAQNSVDTNTTLRERYLKARETYLKEVNFYKNARQGFIRARKKYRILKNEENKAILEEEAKSFLKKVISTLIKRLESLKEWISNRKSISEEDKQKIIAEITKDINWLEEQLASIDTATPQEIKEMAKTIRNYWRKHRFQVKRIIGAIWSARINFIIQKAKSASLKVNSLIEKLKAEGKDTSALEKLLSEFTEKLDLAEGKLEEAKEKFEAISSLAEADNFFREGHRLIKEAHSYLRESYRILVDIVQEIKNLLATESSESGEEQ